MAIKKKNPSTVRQKGFFDTRATPKRGVRGRLALPDFMNE